LKIRIFGTYKKFVGDKMKMIQCFILILLLSNLFFLVGCELSDTSKLEAGEEEIPTAEEGTGISEVFEDTEEVNPPEVPT